MRTIPAAVPNTGPVTILEIPVTGLYAYSSVPAASMAVNNETAIPPSGVYHFESGDELTHISFFSFSLAMVRLGDELSDEE